MHQKILDYLKTQRVCVLAVEMMDGSPHGATVHFAHSEDPCIFYFETNRSYKKAEPLFGRPETRATVVVGCSEGDMQTLQMDGIARLLTDAEKDIYEKVYLGKFPEKKEKSQSDEYVRFVFIPHWWRYTDWTGAHGKEVITSENQ